jgi:hypothetical protein
LTLLRFVSVPTFQDSFQSQFIGKLKDLTGSSNKGFILDIIAILGEAARAKLGFGGNANLLLKDDKGITKGPTTSFRTTLASAILTKSN